MKISAKRLRRSIDTAISELAKSEALGDYNLSINASHEDRTVVSWNGSIGASRPHRDRYVLRDYVRDVRDRQYHMKLLDGSLVQMTYFVREGEVVGHRLAYIPSPIELLDDPELDPVDLETRVRMSMDLDAVSCVGPWRFDFAPEDAGADHAASHLTVNHSECRVPVKYPVSPRRFLELVFGQLHREKLPTPQIADPTTNQCLDDEHQGWFLDVRQQGGIISRI